MGTSTPRQGPDGDVSTWRDSHAPPPLILPPSLRGTHAPEPAPELTCGALTHRPMISNRRGRGAHAHPAASLTHRRHPAKPRGSAGSPHVHVDPRKPPSCSAPTCGLGGGGRRRGPSPQSCWAPAPPCATSAGRPHRRAQRPPAAPARGARSWRDRPLTREARRPSRRAARDHVWRRAGMVDHLVFSRVQARLLQPRAGAFTHPLRPLGCGPAALILPRAGMCACGVSHILAW